jgi:hypothetical protein
LNEVGIVSGADHSSVSLDLRRRGATVNPNNGAQRELRINFTYPEQVPSVNAFDSFGMKCNEGTLKLCDQLFEEGSQIFSRINLLLKKIDQKSNESTHQYLHPLRSKQANQLITGLTMILFTKNNLISLDTWLETHNLDRSNGGRDIEHPSDLFHGPQLHRQDGSRLPRDPPLPASDPFGSVRAG